MLAKEYQANYRPVSNSHFVGQLIEQVVAEQLLAYLNGTSPFDSFKYGFSPGFGTRIALTALVDALCFQMDGCNVSLLIHTVSYF